MVSVQKAHRLLTSAEKLVGEMGNESLSLGSFRGKGGLTVTGAETSPPRSRAPGGIVAGRVVVHSEALKVGLHPPNVSRSQFLFQVEAAGAPFES